MITFVLMLKRKSGLTKEQFKEHYESSHVALAKKHVGHLFKDYLRNYINTTTFADASGYAFTESQNGAYDSITTMVFENEAAFAECFRILNQPEVKAAFQADEEKFMDRSKMCMNLCEGVRTWVTADLN